MRFTSLLSSLFSFDIIFLAAFLGNIRKQGQWNDYVIAGNGQN